ncbi:MAG: GYD domain-containing protein [Thaumarchaeota archaeon]|nr:GYD domain-containing protein [Nitrososphaerota archaeon]
MPHFVVLLKWTDQGIRAAKESPKRAAAARKWAEDHGGKLWLWYTLGKYDVVGVAELPSDEVAFEFGLALGTQGNVRSTTMRAWPEEAAATVIGKLP